jgi:heme A synthase
MDLTQATGSGGVPTDILTNSGSAAVGSPKPDRDWGLVSHMAFMLIAFVVLFPVGYLLLRYADSVKYHWWMQSTAICLVVLGVGTGINESKLYNKVRNRLLSNAYMMFD